MAEQSFEVQQFRCIDRRVVVDSVHIQARPSDTIRSLSEQIFTQLGIPLDRQLLSSGSLQLLPEERDGNGVCVRQRTLSEYRIAGKIALTDYQTVAPCDRGVLRIIETERRAISVSQLERVHSYVLRQCQELDADHHTCFAWHDRNRKKLTYEDMNLYHLADWVIRPATYHARCSFVELIAKSAEAQVPQWFASHWWGEQVVRFLQCLREHCNIRGMSSLTTTYWVCAFANNQHELSAEIVPDPTQTSFFRAMQLSRGVLCILDDEGTVFTRIWCSLEASTAVTQPLLLLDIASAHKWTEYGRSAQGAKMDRQHVAVVITDGLTSEEFRSERLAPGSGSRQKSLRESRFPPGLITAGLDIDITNSKASVEMDRKRILNSIAERSDDLDAAPLKIHVMYDRVNIRLRSIFALASWQKAVAEDFPGLSAFSSIVCSDTDRTEVRLNFSHVPKFNDDRLGEVAAALHLNLQSLQLLAPLCHNLTEQGLTRLADALPQSLRNLDISLSFNQGFGDGGVVAISSNLPPKLKTLKLHFSGCRRVGDVGLEALSSKMPQSLKMLELSFARTAVSDDSVSVLASSLPQSLRSLSLSFEGCKRLKDRAVEKLLDSVLSLPSLNALAVNFISTGVPDDVVAAFKKWKPSAAAESLHLQDDIEDVVGSPKVAAELLRKTDSFKEGRCRLAAGVNTREVVFGIFQEWDANHDGLISVPELEHVLQALDSSMTSQKCQKLFTHADVNNDGKIDVDEFIAWLFE